MAIDLGAVESIDSVAAAALSEGIAVLERRGQRVGLSRLTERQRTALDLVSVPSLPSTALAPSAPGARRGQLRALLDLAELMVDTWASWVKMPLAREKLRLKETAEQAVRLGVDAFPVVALLSFLTGLILAFQASFQLRRFGAEPLVAEIPRGWRACSITPRRAASRSPTPPPASNGNSTLS